MLETGWRAKRQTLFSYVCRKFLRLHENVQPGLKFSRYRNCPLGSFTSLCLGMEHWLIPQKRRPDTRVVETQPITAL